MKDIPSFDKHHHSFVQEEARKEADAVLSEKDPPRAEFTLANIRKFSYKNELDKLQRNNPLLLGKPSSKKKSQFNFIFNAF